ncbi:MAG TPA: nucleotidyltransferase family protein [Pyrinomonadaceae bacterium]|jgi:molybdenum cofactor cytidylyltransferase|nr:nucleotidyltransferase family protein [Pyrinomonadaceae bacterium]
MGIGAIVLAAGGSSRLGTPKQLVMFRGETLVRRAAKAALASICDRVVVVVGNHAQQMRQEIDDLPVSVVENEDWRSGISSSIRAGLEQISSQDGVVITLCDQPFVTAAVLNNLVSTRHKTRRAIVASTYGTTRGVPAFFAPELFNEIASLTKDEGARRIIASHPEKVATIKFPEGAMDIDTPEDRERLMSQL